MMTTKLAAIPNIDLERYRVNKWDDIVGNDECVTHFKQILRLTRFSGHRSGFNTLITGPSRGGKTVMVKMLLKCAICLNLSEDTLNPCMKCNNCLDSYEVHGNQGWENVVDFLDEGEVKTPVRGKILIVNCADTTESELDEVVRETRSWDDELKFVYLDEVHRLHRRNLDERLLKPIEDSHAIWIGTSANIQKDSVNDRTKLDPMFQNRFSFRLSLQRPSVPKLAVWLAKRCQEAGIKVDDPCKEILELVASSSDCIPGLALQVLNSANKSRDRVVTRELVERFRFSFDS